MMKSDIEIAQEAVMLPIQEVAAQLDLTEDDLELYGKYKAKLSDDCLRRFSDQPDGKLILGDFLNGPSFFENILPTITPIDHPTRYFILYLFISSKTVSSQSRFL